MSLTGCLGNRLFWATDELGVRTLKISLPHHKNAVAWGGQAIGFTLPQPLPRLFKRYLKWGHQVIHYSKGVIWKAKRVAWSVEASCLQILTEYQGNEDVQLVFVDKQARGFTDATFCLYWQAWLESKAGVRVSPQVLH